jgi:5-methylcytosine-specific restriction endonuclease McrA
MDADIREKVRLLANNRCEYCRLPQEFSGLLFHVDHVVPRKHGGTDQLDNLALACPECNLRKGTNLSGMEPETGRVISLFHPRRDRWEQHFKMEEAIISLPLR